MVCRTTGTVTSLDGEFSINVKVGQEVVVSSLGYDSYTFKPTSAGRMVITLNSSSEYLDDVVVIGYGSTTKANSSKTVRINRCIRFVFFTKINRKSSCILQ